LEGYVVLLSPDVVRLEKETCATQRRDTLAESDRDLALDEWHTVQLVVIGHRIRVLVDGQEQIDFTDRETPLLGGDVIVETENNVEFSLDNFYVYEVIPEEGGIVATPTPTALPIESVAPGGPAPDTRDIRPCAWDGLGPGLCIFAWEGGDPPVRLLKDAELEFTSAPSWSPDGQRIAFSAQEPGAESEHPNDIYVANADGTGLQALPSDRNDIVPAWSPDGEWLAFHSNCDLALMHPDGSDFTVIWPHEDGCTMVPQWSPDGEWIVLSLVPDGEWAFPMTREVWVISRDGDIITPVATVTHPSQECFQDTVALSPDNARVAYFEAGCRPMIVNADGTGGGPPQSTRSGARTNLSQRGDLCLPLNLPAARFTWMQTRPPPGATAARQRLSMPFRPPSLLPGLATRSKWQPALMTRTLSLRGKRSLSRAATTPIPGKSQGSLPTRSLTVEGGTAPS
jgi:hypothetical protein